MVTRQRIRTATSKTIVRRFSVPVIASHYLLYKIGLRETPNYTYFLIHLLCIIHNLQPKSLYRQQKAADMREKSHISRSYFLIKDLHHHQPER